MTNRTEAFAARAATLTGNRIYAVVAAFQALFERSWPHPGIASRIEHAEHQRAAADACRALLAALDEAHTEFPTAMFWWKNERSEFLGFCTRFAHASGLAPLELLGRTDADPDVAWNRQAALYMRDDREVLLARAPKFDIVERQDRGGETVWLRTSKVPYSSAAGAGTVGGFDTISAARATELARRRR